MRGVAVLLVLGSFAPRALAQTPDADALVREALELRRRGDDLAALARLDRAWELAPSPRVRAQQGFAEQALGRWPLAEEHLDEALRAVDDPWVRSRRAVLEEAVGVVRAHLGTLRLRCDVAARWSLDGEGPSPPRTDVAVRVEVGEHAVVARGDGLREEPRRVRVEAGSVAEVVCARGAPATRTVPPRGEPPAAPAPTASPWPWALGATGVVGLGLGVGMLLVRNAAATRWNDPSCLRDGRTRVENCGAELEAGEAAEAVSAASFVLGGAALLGSVVWWSLSPRRAERGLSLRCAPLAGAWGAGCEGRF